MTDLPIADFHFLRPLWFLALIPLVLLVFYIRQVKKTHSGWQSVIASHLYNHLVSGQIEKSGNGLLGLLMFGWLLATTALAGPTWQRLPQPVFQVQEGQVIVIDMSLSMRATDITPDRLTRAKYKAIDIVKGISEGETGLVAYAGDAFTISPLTTDASNLVALLPSLSPEIMPVTGSDAYRGLAEAQALLENAGYQKGTIFWITDGIDREQQRDLSTLISDMPYTVNILGVGTKDGAPIRRLDGELVKDQRGQIVIPKLQDSALQSLARQSGGVFSSISSDDTDVKRLIARSGFAADAKATDEKTSADGDQWEELGPWLLLLVLPFAASVFRRGIIAVFLVAPMTLWSPQQALAQTSTEQISSEQQAHTPWFKRPFLNRDQQGMAAYEAEDYNQAAETFVDPQWRGAAEYEAGNFAAALDAFSSSNTPEALYNQGNALAQLGEYDDAIARYDAVLEQDPEHADAAANKALLETLKKQQEQQQGDDQGEQNQQDEQNQQNGQDQQGDQNPQQGNQNDSQQTQQPDEQSQQNAGDESHQDQRPNEQSQHEAEQPSDTDKNKDTDAKQEPSNEEKTEQIAQSQADELTDEEKEKMQRLENMMKKIPDDPAFLLKRKMQLEAQKRRRQGPPSNRSDW